MTACLCEVEAFNATRLRDRSFDTACVCINVDMKKSDAGISASCYLLCAILPLSACARPSHPLPQFRLNFLFFHRVNYMAAACCCA